MLPGAAWMALNCPVPHVRVDCSQADQKGLKHLGKILSISLISTLLMILFNSCKKGAYNKEREYKLNMTKKIMERKIRAGQIRWSQALT